MRIGYQTIKKKSMGFEITRFLAMVVISLITGISIIVTLLSIYSPKTYHYGKEVLLAPKNFQKHAVFDVKYCNRDEQKTISLKEYKKIYKFLEKQKNIQYKNLFYPVMAIYIPNTIKEKKNPIEFYEIQFSENNWVRTNVVSSDESQQWVYFYDPQLKTFLNKIINER